MWSIRSRQTDLLIRCEGLSRKVDGLVKDQTIRVLSEVSSRGFTIITFNAGVYIPLTARCDNAPDMGKNTVLTQRDRLPFFQFFSYLGRRGRTISVRDQSENMRWRYSNAAMTSVYSLLILGLMSG